MNVPVFVANQTAAAAGAHPAVDGVTGAMLAAAIFGPILFFAVLWVGFAVWDKMNG